MSRLEWLIVAAMMAIAFAVTFTHLDGTVLGRWLSGQPLPEMQQSADDRWFYAIFPLALLIWWSAAWFPNARDFLRTGAWVVLGAGVLMALWQLAS
jgi:hypothetical protein